MSRIERTRIVSLVSQARSSLGAISSSPMKSALVTLPLLAILLLDIPCGRLAAQHFHRLPATPRTVAYGYYNASAAPGLRLASGDTQEAEPLITYRTGRPEAARVPPAPEQQSLRDILQ